jgi:hypothetical protein
MTNTGQPWKVGLLGTLQGDIEKGDSMNVRKGYFRLTLVLSVLVGVIASLTMEWRHRIYEVKEEIFYTKELSAPPPLFMSEKDGYSYQDIIDRLRQEEEPKPIFTRTMKIEWKEMSRVPTDSDYKKIFWKEEFLPKELIEDKSQSRTTRYTVLGVEYIIRWKEPFFRLLLGFSSVWAIYAFIRLVVVAFIIGGFKSKSEKGGDL